MRILQGIGLAALLLGTTSLAAAVPRPDATIEDATPDILERQADPACTNGPLTRSCWQSGYSIATDFDAKVPPNGQTREYNLEVTNMTLSPDGTSRQVLAINGQYPGPTLTANWGDNLVIHVTNSLKDNGTSMHWHGIRQLNSNQNDGANGVTECPIPPGATVTYRFRCTQFGTTWYHSHHSAQYGDGVVGTLIINGPASANYDVDLGTLPITDWFYTPNSQLLGGVMHTPGPAPAPNNILVNGKMVNANGEGSYHKITVTKGKKYRIRLINTSVDTVFSVSIDGHTFQIITSDFVPIRAKTATSVTLNIGQRYDIIVNTNQAVNNYWLRVHIASCSAVQNTNLLGAIFHYDGASDGDPTTTSSVGAPACADETGLVPYVANTVPSAPFLSTVAGISVNVQVGQQDNLVTWTINGTGIKVDWSHPTLEHVINGDTNFGSTANIINLDTANKWYYWVVQSAAGAPPLQHPIHLHGHDFYILASGSGQYDFSTSGLNFNNPTRRDVATLPPGGWLLLAFPADNPGAWLMHCHIAWHVSEGLSLQFLERKDEILSAIGDTSQLTSNCAAWRSWFSSSANIYGAMPDSGI